MKQAILVLGILTGIFLQAQQVGQDYLPLVKIADRVREAFTSAYWEEWSSVPFSLLLVKDDYEYLHHIQAEDTTFQKDSHGVQFRKATFNKHFLATFPLIRQKPTIVVGTPDNTGKSPEEWIVTLLHEHFHQLQFSHPEYYTAQAPLGLAKGDETGMWMLNHPFPYDQPEVVRLVKSMSGNLLKLYHQQPLFSEILKEHKNLKKELRNAAGQEHYAYLNLQLWQEGFARYMEIRLLEDWNEHFDQVDQDLFTPAELQALKHNYHERIKRDLASGDLANMKRAYFYSLGAAEAMLIAQTNPDWKARYFNQLYDTDHLLASR